MKKLLFILLAIVTNIISTGLALAFACALAESSMGYMGAGILLIFSLALTFTTAFFICLLFDLLWWIGSILANSLTILILGGTICANLAMGTAPFVLIIPFILIVIASFAGGLTGKNMKERTV